ncbi:MAG: NotI family restriction endonuclease, partial [Terriglobia bacterium]
MELQIGQKRLMPQLQIKVPTLRRWGKKMAVVVDHSFFFAMGKMRTVPHITNCDVAWFVVRYEAIAEGRYRLVRDAVQFTTLEDSVEGLTAGVPVSLEVFEKRILAKLGRLSGPS